MNAIYKFSEQQLDKLKDEYLINLAKYYEIPINKKTGRTELIEKIIKKQKEMPNYYGGEAAQQEQNVGMSPRVRRIKEWQEKQNE